MGTTVHVHVKLHTVRTVRDGRHTATLAHAAWALDTWTFLWSHVSFLGLSASICTLA